MIGYITENYATVSYRLCVATPQLVYQSSTFARRTHWSHNCREICRRDKPLVIYWYPSIVWQVEQIEIDIAQQNYFLFSVFLHNILKNHFIRVSRNIETVKKRSLYFVKNKTFQHLQKTAQKRIQFRKNSIAAKVFHWQTFCF